MSLQNKFAALAASSLVLVSSAAWCGDYPPAPSTGGKFDQVAEAVGAKVDQAESAIKRQAHKAGEAIGDAAVTTKVKAAIAAEPGLHVLQIKVDTTDGVVTLHGAVDSKTARKKAEDLAAKVEGVKSVVNHLAVSRG
jgi:hyperosmotically inducible periplasmic protein